MYNLGVKNNMADNSNKIKGIVLFFAIITLAVAIFYLGAFFGKTNNEENKAESINALTIDEKTIKTKVVAVDNKGVGVTADLFTEIRPGSGLVLVNINDLLADINTQYSARIATQVAKNFTGFDLSNVDVIFNLKAQANVIGGQSAGSAMAISVIAALANKTLRDDIIITGSVLEDGTVGEAGSIKEKARAAKNSGAELFLIPYGVGSEAKDYRKVKRCGNVRKYDYCEVFYEEEKIRIGDELGIDVKEVKTVSEALVYFIENVEKEI